MCPWCVRWVWTTTGGWWVQPRHWRRNFAVAVVGVAGLAVSLYAYSDARESYTDFATQSVWYSSLDQRKRWIKREEKARKLKELNYSKELGQRPTYDQ